MKKKSFVNHLYERVCGRSHSTLIGLKTYKRWQNLAIDSSCDLERVNSSALNCIDTECISGRYLLSGYNEGLITIHDLAEILYRKGGKLKTARLIANSPGLHVERSHTKSVTGVHWYPHDTGMFTSSSMDAYLFVWDTQQMRVAEKLSFSPSRHKRTSYILSHSISHSCMVAMGGSPPEISIWSIKTGTVTHVLKAHQHRVNAVEWSPVCSELLVSTGDGGKVFLWDIRQPKEYVWEFDYLNRTDSPFVKDRRAHACLAVPMLKFLACGSRFITCGVDGEISVWNALKGVKEQQVFALAKSSSDFCKQLTLTPYMNNTQIIYVPSSASIAGFDVNTGQKITSLQGHYNRVNVCQAHYNEELLYSGGIDGEMLFWKPREDIVVSAKRIPIADNVDDWSDSDIDS
ncbi:DNA excision repair protein ERCC-8 isoform X1 [Oopsacas minuta]|uniref:DNA excision repair protein ERCC-8 isoform X1 n=1 Tax=Oopsacas minuta TaxID=111878 RepID=A0AAV7JWG0_9METZ|nr:DNA excision repair protein ERCC-8 isoform X1 [Oopsacas minuta]